MVHERIRQKCRECGKVRDHGQYFEARGNCMRTIGRCVECDRERGRKGREARKLRDGAKKPPKKAKKPTPKKAKVSKPERAVKVKATPTPQATKKPVPTSKPEKLVEPKTTTKAVNAVARQPVTTSVTPAPTTSAPPTLPVATKVESQPREMDAIKLPAPVVVPGHTPPSKELLEGMIEVLKEGEVDLTDQMTEDAILKALVFCARGVLDISDRSMPVRYLAEARAKAGRLAKLRAEQEQRIADAKAGRLGVAAG